jgi:hypothetical protein
VILPFCGWYAARYWIDEGAGNATGAFATDVCQANGFVGLCVLEEYVIAFVPIESVLCECSDYASVNADTA